MVAVQGGRHLAEHIIVADPAVLPLDPGGVCLKLFDGIDRQIIGQLNQNLSQALQALRNGIKIRTNLNIVPFFRPFFRYKAFDSLPAWLTQPPESF